MLSLKPRPFVQSFFVLRYACAPTATRSYLTTVCLLFFVLVSLETSLFPSIFCTSTVFSPYGEYAVCSPFPDNGVFLACEHGLDFLQHLM